MKKLFLILLLAMAAIVLSACATGPAVSVPQTVKVPITVYCKAKSVPKPDMPFDNQAQPSMTLYQKTQLLAAQDQNLKGYATQLEGALAGCAVPPDAAGDATATK